MRALLLIMTLITLVILISTCQVGLPVLLPELNSLSSHLLAGSQTIINPQARCFHRRCVCISNVGLGNNAMQMHQGHLPRTTQFRPR